MLDNNTEKLAKTLSVTRQAFRSMKCDFLRNKIWAFCFMRVEKRRQQPVTNPPQVELWHAQLTAADMRWQTETLSPVLNEQTCLPVDKTAAAYCLTDQPPTPAEKQSTLIGQVADTYLNRCQCALCMSEETCMTLSRMFPLSFLICCSHIIKTDFSTHEKGIFTICKWVKGYSLLCLFLAYFPFLGEQLPHAETAGKKETEAGTHNINTHFE